MLIGYFLAKNLNSKQKVGLIRHALHELETTCIEIISLTFHGCSSNVTAAQLLGCNFNINALSISFPFGCLNNEKIVLTSFVTLCNKNVVQ